MNQKKLPRRAGMKSELVTPVGDPSSGYSASYQVGIATVDSNVWLSER
jgi:hypothetical protein